MPTKNRTILGINPGSRYFSIAVFEGTDLRDWRIRSLEGDFPTRLRTTLTLISSYVDQYHPATLAMKVIHPSRRSAHLNAMMGKILGFAKKNGLPLRQCSIKELKHFFSPQAKINKGRLAELVVSAHPILCHELDREKRIKNRYYQRMFEAVATASLCFYQLEKMSTYAKS